VSEAHYILRNDTIRQRAAEAILNLPDEPLMEIVVRDFVKTRSLPQNARYWASLNENLRLIEESIRRVAEYTGHSNLEIRRLIAKELPPEYIAILFSSSAEAAHDILKLIVGVPTSTRLGTKAFSQFEGRMEETMAQISGEINNFAARITT